MIKVKPCPSSILKEVLPLLHLGWGQHFIIKLLIVEIPGLVKCRVPTNLHLLFIVDVSMRKCAYKH